MCIDDIENDFFPLFLSKPITKLANEIHCVNSKFNGALYNVHITEENYTVGTIKKCSHSESRGFHQGGGETQLDRALAAIPGANVNWRRSSIR